MPMYERKIHAKGAKSSHSKGHVDDVDERVISRRYAKTWSKIHLSISIFFGCRFLILQVFFSKHSSLKLFISSCFV